jgi:antitoxin component YwqK of YwqJK toxin-antitoxin module
MQKIILTISLLFCANTLFSSALICKDKKAYIIEDNAQKSAYKNCVRNGMTYWYKDDGSIKSKVNFTNGQEDGLYTSYHTNGKEKIVVHYVGAQKDGIQKIYYDNGVLGSKVTYNMGRREGIMTDWDSEGYKSAEVFYKNNYKVGLKKYFDHKGNVTKTETYKMDRNPVMVKLLKDKAKEIMIDLAKYGLVPEDAPKEERFR